jgi:bifunctional non-homologous end joining protein LigD
VERIIGAMQTPDGYWRVEVYRSGREQWYRVLHANTVVNGRAAIGTVQRILGDQYADLEPAPVEPAA